MNKKLQVWLPVLFAIVMVLGMAVGFKLREKTAGKNFFLFSKKNSVDEVMNLIKNKYVDEVGIDSLQDAAIETMLSKLDPHSVYIPAKDLMTANEDLQGEFQGVGVEFQIFNDTVNVINVIKDGPSDKAGIQTGDKFIKADTTNLIKVKNTDIIRKALRGPGGTPVKVTIMSDGKIKEVTITRGTIPLPALYAGYMIAPNIGYINLSKFSETTYEEFMEALEKLQKQGMQKLILDLRGNGGGFLNEAVQIADEFLDGSKLIVYTEGKNNPKEEHKAQRDGLFEKGGLVLLVDETSASASEVLAGALQDWDRATIIGRRTFGKGLVQGQYNLSDGSALRLTIAKYYTPLGRNIQKPYTQGREQYDEELIKRFTNGEVVHGDTTTPDTKPYKTPGGRTVYGGGGITPDIFVPYDTARTDKNVAALTYNNTLNNFVYSSFVNNKNYFKQFKTPAEFAKNYNISNEDLARLQSFAKRDSINIISINAKEKEELNKRIKALMARQIWRNEGFYEVYNLTDNAVAKALEILNK